MNIPTENELYQVRMPKYLRDKVRVMAGLRGMSIQRLLEHLINQAYEKPNVLGAKSK